ncbi:MAG: tetratricopeptide repeat protein [Planctomycetes bacterium]|nr:tetratricopeptide repeat protein [Planctomycetota bacterium]
MKLHRPLRSLTFVALLATATLSVRLHAQDTNDPAHTDIDRMVRQGMAEALEARFRGGRTPEELGWIAQAYANKARRDQKAEREQAFQQAEKRYLKWIDAAANAAQGDAAVRAVATINARYEYANMITSAWAARELDEFEITAGQRGDRDGLQALFEKARAQYALAREALIPLRQELALREDEFLALGIYDRIKELHLDIAFNLGWASLYAGLVMPPDGQGRSAALRDAAQEFQGLIDSGQTGPTMYQCYLGLAMALREQGRFDEAERNFGFALDEGVEPAVAAQVRYELARCQLAVGKFNEARVTLEPLVNKDAARLDPEDQASKFHIYLAYLWDANSYLIEAEAQRRQAPGSPSRTAILRQAQRARERGLAKMNRLRRLRGPWPAIVQLYVAASVDAKADLQTLSPTELLLTAQQLMDSQQYQAALERLQAALERDEIESDLNGELLFELGKCQYLLKDNRSAAQTFQDMAREHKSHERAPQAAAYAYQLWAELANKSTAKADYAHLADTLLNLLESFPEHEKRAEAMWWLPVALQHAGRYAEAAEQFGKVPDDSRHAEEARFRRAVCTRQACEATRGQLSEEEYSRHARRAAADLLRYAGDALARAATALDPESVRDWSAQARVHAAELQIAPGVARYREALATLEPFEQHYASSPHTGRALAARIRAYRGVREYDQAAKVLDQYLQTVPAEQAGAVLSVLAQGMQEEVERLREDGQSAAARKLAEESIPTFQQLEQWFLADPRRAKNAQVAAFGLVRMTHLAGRLDEARQKVEKLLTEDPKNGNYRRLHALLLTEQLAPAAPAADVQQAQEAWATLLKDPAIRTQAPQRYWEARYHWLALALRLGQAADVEKAIRQERIWYSDLGGPPWHEKLNALYQEAAQQANVTPQTAPASRPARNAP